MGRRVLLATVAALTISGAANAQSWTPVQDAPDGMTAAAAQWPSGVNLVARCDADQRLDLMMALVQPVSQRHVAVTFTIGAEEPSEQRWRLSENGSVVFVRQPGAFSRSLINDVPLTILLTPDEGPRHRYELESPEGGEVLAHVVQTCGHPLTSPVGENSIITNPDWVRRPNGSSLARWYPQNAMMRGIDGQATIQCRITTTGRTDDCIVLSESPEGENFGAATLAIAEEFQMSPQRVDGRPVGEALVNIPINWDVR